MVTEVDYLLGHFICDLEESGIPGTTQQTVVQKNVTLRNPDTGLLHRCPVGCGCNVFHKYDDGTFGCNSCNCQFEGE